LRHYLVVANQTLGTPQLVEHLVACHGAGPCDFHLLVPATHAHDHVRWTPGEAMALARRRLYAALDHLRTQGLTVHGTVGDPSPVVAIGAMLRQRQFDELILCTLAPGPSQWLANRLPERARELYGLPVTHLVAGPLDVAATATG
jgi:hypothetical protein